MPYIYVLAPDGKPLMPTTRKRYVQKLLNKGKARIASHVPYTIQLKYETPGITQPVMAGQDPGRTNIGIAVLDKCGNALLTAVCETRNKEIPKLMQERKAHRQTSRRGERKSRQRLARKHGTTVTGGELKRILSKCEEPIICHDIRNTESRFCNRKRKKGWITPTANQLLQTHISLILKASKYVPITDVTLEVNRFAFALLDNPNLQGLDFQNGPLKGFDSVEQAVYIQQNGTCMMCSNKIKHYHHIVPKSKGGSNTLDNYAGLCECCHTKVHKDTIFEADLKTKKSGMMKKYGALSVLNQIIPYLAEQLAVRFGEDHVHFVTGAETKYMRECFGYDSKDWHKNPLHDVDAVMIALLGLGLTDTQPQISKPYSIKQYRRHERSLINNQRERTYKLGKETVSKNRNKRMEQKTDSLAEWYQKQIKIHGLKEAERLRSVLTVEKSTRRYNTKNRIIPGAVFTFHGKEYVLSGQLSNGQYLRAVGDTKTNFPARNCVIVRHNEGLVFL